MKSHIGVEDNNMANHLSKYGSIQPRLQFNDNFIHIYCPCLYYPQYTHTHTPSSSP
jgi:hypothetical protein